VKASPTIEKASVGLARKKGGEVIEARLEARYTKQVTSRLAAAGQVKALSREAGRTLAIHSNASMTAWAVSSDERHPASWRGRLAPQPARLAGTKL
jgi:hypothetical protein